MSNPTDNTTTNILIVDTLYWDRFLSCVNANNLAMYNALKKTNLWNGHGDKADLPPAEYTLVNQLIENTDVFPHIPNIGGTGANIYMSASRALKNSGHKLRLIFFSTSSNDTSGSHIKRKLAEQESIVIEIDPARQSAVISPTSFHFSLDGKKQTAKGPGNGNLLLNEKDAEAVFSMKDKVTDEPIKIHRMFMPGSVVGRFKEETLFALLEQSKAKNTQIVYAPPTSFNAKNRIFNNMMLESYASCIRANMPELCESFNIGNLKNLTDDDKHRTMQIAIEMVSKRAHLQPSVAVSDGLNGAWLAMPGMDIKRTPILNPETKLVDNTGAGDNFVAGVEAGLFLGNDTPKTFTRCGYIGAAFSDLCIQHKGAQIPTEYDLSKLAESAVAIHDHILMESEGPEIFDHLGNNILPVSEIPRIISHRFPEPSNAKI